MRRFFWSREFGVAWILVAAATLLLTWIGWGWWGYSVAGDYSLELADAIRFHYGQIPYRDFIPTYGALTMFLLAPFFSLGIDALPFVWFATVILILLEFGLLFLLLKKLSDHRFFILGGLLFAFTVVWIPTNAGYLMGYSTAGFVSVILWSLILYLLIERPDSDLRTVFFLGIQLYTKLDMGLLAVLILIWILIRHLIAKRLSHCVRLIFSFLTPSIFIIGTLLLRGAHWDLLLGSTLEALGQAAYVRDEILGKRLFFLGVLGLVLSIYKTTSFYRRLRIVNRVPLGFAVLFCMAAIWDTYRILYLQSNFGIVALYYFWAVAITWIASDVLARLYEVRSWGDFQEWMNHPKMVMFLIAGVGLFRCAVSGWFPLNYYQPAPFLLACSLLFHPETWVLRIRKSLLWIGIVAYGISEIISIMPRKSLVWFQTPYGKVRFETRSDNFERFSLYQELQKKEKKDGLLCTYMTGAYLFTGVEPFGLYTYWHRLSATGKFRAEREALALKLLQERPPKFILIEKEQATFAPQFGVQFGLEIFSWIKQNYNEEKRMDVQKESWTFYQQKEKSHSVSKE